MKDGEGKKEKQSSLKEMQKILEEVNRGVKKHEIVRRYGINSSTLSTFIKDRAKTEKNIKSIAIRLQRK
jgi:hypothetical protein